jgi:hypothetical protein
MLIAWALFKPAYQQLTIVLLIGIFYLLPKKRQKDKTIINGKSNQVSKAIQLGQTDER